MNHDKYKTVDELINDLDWGKQMDAGGLDGWNNYSGPDMSGWIVAASRSRDSDLVTESNFQAMLDLLGKRHTTVERFGHWACGWVETIMVRSTARKTLEKLRGALNALAYYPVLDDELYSEMQNETGAA